MFTVRRILSGLAFCIALSVVAGIFAGLFSLGFFSPVSGKEAAAAATSYTGGYAREVEFEYNYHTGAHYEVEVIANGMEHDVIVDADSGKVLAVKTKHRKYRG